MVICLERGADLHMTQLMPLPLTDSCFSKIQIGFTFLVPAHPGSPGQRAIKRVSVSVQVACVPNLFHLLLKRRHETYSTCGPTWCRPTYSENDDSSSYSLLCQSRSAIVEWSREAVCYSNLNNCCWNSISLTKTNHTFDRESYTCKQYLDDRILLTTQ